MVIEMYKYQNRFIIESNVESMIEAPNRSSDTFNMLAMLFF